MRILHFAQNVAGGISSYFDEIAFHQIERYGQGNVVFLMPGRDVANLTRVPLDCVETFDHVERTGPELFRLAILARGFTERFRPDIVHLHSTFAGVIFRSILPFLKHKPKVVYCPHGWAFAREQSAQASFFYARLEQLMMRWTNVCINISENEARLAAAYGLPLDKCVTVSNGISPANHYVSPIDAAAGGPLKLLFVGRHDPQKGIDILLKAMQTVDRPDLRLDVAGSAVVSRISVDHLATAPGVTLLGHVSRSEVGQLMERCDAIVVPSRWEGFGLVVLEAMRAGKPAIVSPNGALPDLVEDGRTGLVLEDLEPKTLAGVLRSLDKFMLERMGAGARERFFQLYTSERMNAEIDAIYERLAPIGSSVPLDTSRQSAPKMSRV